MRWHSSAWRDAVIVLAVAATIITLAAMHRPVCVCTCSSPPHVDATLPAG